MEEGTRWLGLGGGYRVLVDRHHRFGADAFLLAAFARPAGVARAVDIGTGCGVIPFLWHRWQKAPGHVTAVELQPQAAALLRAGIQANGLQGRVEAVQGDVALLAARCPGQWQMACCNPPYFALGSGRPSRHPEDLASRHEQQLPLPALCAAAGRLLQFGGRLCVCYRPERLADLVCQLRAAGLEPKRVRFVQRDGASAPWLVLAEAKKGGRPGLVVLPPFLQQGADGRPTPEAAALFGSGKEEGQ